jgi:GNAT superfamily N-acetyltransferase
MDIEFSGTIFEWRGPAPYHFIAMSEKQSGELAELAAAATYGWGMLRSSVGIGGTEWTTSLWKKDGRYVVPVKDAVRKAEELNVDDTVSVRLSIIRSAEAGRGHSATPPDRPIRRSRPAVGSRKSAPINADQLTIVPANEASWPDLQAIFGTSGDSSRCWCQRYKMEHRESWASVGAAELAARLQQQSGCGGESSSTSGLVAYLDREPVGWCAVGPRSAHPRLKRDCRVPWTGRSQDKNDGTVWAVTCLLTRVGFRRRGVSHALAKAAVDFSRRNGARALEGYPDLVEVSHVGSHHAFADAGLAEVSRPTVRRAVMRIDF